MKKLWVLMLSIALVSLTATGAGAAIFSMAEQATYKNGAISDTIYDPNVDFTAPLTWSATFSTAGSYNFILFIDPEIDQVANTYFNEYGVVKGSAAAGQSWEIDEPGWTYGDIFNNFSLGALDNSNGVPMTAPDDVSMALGWKFTLAPGQTAKLSFLLSDSEPTSGFYLAQVDPENAALYFSSTLNINGGTQVPEPSVLTLFGSGLAGLAIYARKRKRISKTTDN